MYAKVSGFFMAMRFGKSSPNTIVKIDRIIVIKTSEAVCNTENLIPIFKDSKKRAIFVAKLLAAKALARNPAKVMPTCMVARNFSGAAYSFNRQCARLSPAAARFSALASLKLIKAISAPENSAFTIISTSCNRSCHKSGSSIF
jgi:hypothetical protein